MVRFITRYMARVRRLRFYIKITIDRRFAVTIATDTVRNTQPRPQGFSLKKYVEEYSEPGDALG